MSVADMRCVVGEGEGRGTRPVDRARCRCFFFFGIEPLCIWAMGGEFGVGRVRAGSVGWAAGVSKSDGELFSGLGVGFGFGEAFRSLLGGVSLPLGLLAGGRCADVVVLGRWCFRVECCRFFCYVFLLFLLLQIG